MGTALSELIAQAAYGQSAWKQACRTVSTGNITLSGAQSVSGVSLNIGDRVLVAGQTSSAQNGPYLVSNGPWTRTVDFDTSSDAQLGSTFKILEGTYAGQVWQLTSPTSGDIALGVTALSFGTDAFGDIVTVLPSGDTTGVTDRTRIAAALAAGGEAVLVSGETYTIDQKLDIPSGARLRSTRPGERARIVRSSTWVPGAGTEDAALNAALYVRPASPAAGLSRTTTATSYVGGVTITCNNVVPFSAGQWVRISGVNGGDPLYGQNDSITYNSLAQILSVNSGGNQLTFVDRLGQHHASGASVTITDVIEDVEIRDIELDFSAITASPVAVGVLVSYATNVRLVNVAAHGFSRANFEYDTATECLELGCSSRGRSNSMSLRQRSYLVESRDYVWNGDIERQHPSGTPRGVICDLTANSACSARNGSITRACIAYSSVGNMGCGVDGLRAVDIDSTAAVTRNGDWGAVSVPGKGCVVDSGVQVSVGSQSQGIGNFWLNIQAESAWNNATDGVVFSFKDQKDMEVSNLQVVNTANSPFSPAAGYLAHGVLFNAANGIANSISIRGCTTGIRIAGISRVVMANAYVNGQGGSGTNGSSALVFLTGQGNSTSPRIGQIQVTNLNSPIFNFSSSFTSNPDRRMVILQVFIESDEYTDVVPAKGTAASIGQVVEWTTGADEFAATTAASTKAIVAASPSSNGWAMVATGNAAITFGGAVAPARGDILVSGTGGTAFIDNAPANPLTAAWRVIMSAATGNRAQCVRVIR